MHFNYVKYEFHAFMLKINLNQMWHKFEIIYEVCGSRINIFTKQQPVMFYCLYFQPNVIQLYSVIIFTFLSSHPLLLSPKSYHF